MHTPDTTSRRAADVTELDHLRERTRVDETVDTATAAALIGYTGQTLRRWACEGSGPIRPRRVNGRLRWSVSEIRALLAGA